MSQSLLHRYHQRRLERLKKEIEALKNIKFKAWTVLTVTFLVLFICVYGFYLIYKLGANDFIFTYKMLSLAIGLPIFSILFYWGGNSLKAFPIRVTITIILIFMIIIDPSMLFGGGGKSDDEKTTKEKALENKS